MRRSIYSILISLLCLLFLFFPWNTRAQAETRKPGVDEYQSLHRETDVMKIISVLKKKVGDQKLLEKAKGKLSTMREPEFSLISSLAEHLLREGDRPGVDIAFVLLTALIIFS